MSNNSITRRNLVKAGTAAVAAAAAGASVAHAEELAAQPWMPEKWDRETDVVVIGTGSIITAALRASAEGLDVLVLEKSPDWFGGTTALCGGGVTCFNSTPAMELGCTEIPREVIKDYLMGCADGQSSEEIIDMMIDNYVPAIDFLNDECGYKWTSSGMGDHKAWNIYEPFYEIEEKYSDVPCSVYIGQHEATGAVMGRAIAAFGKDALDARGIEVMMGTAATKLIYAGNPALGDGEVIGVWAETAEGTIAIKARYAVVIGTGGFDHNREMVKNYINAPIYASVAVPTNTGDGHIMAMELGANMRNMNDVYHIALNMSDGVDVYEGTDLSLDNGFYVSEERSQIWCAVGRPGGIVVNKHGERFMNEGSSYDLLGRAFDAYDNGHCEWRNIPGYVVCDSTYEGTFGDGGAPLPALVASGELPAWLHEYATLEELAEGMGINRENLLATVERWNGYCEDGVDPDYARGEGTWDKFTCGDYSRVESGELKNPCMAPIAQPPFYCMEIYPGMIQTAGGIEINTNGQVMNVRGEVIPRLYAGSCAIANTIGRGYGIGGCTVSNGFIVGYVAANHIATLQPWE